LPVPIKIAVTFFFLMLSWVLFRSPSIDHAIGYFRALFDFHREAKEILFLDYATIVALALATLLSFTPQAAFARLGRSGDAVISWVIALSFAWSVSRVAASTFVPFLYFRF
jgi:hypothetical protein